MFPNAHYAPSLSSKAFICVLIPRFVSFDFVSPPIRISFRPGPMFRTSVPETSVDINSDPRPYEDDVRPASTAAYRAVVNPEAKAKRVQARTQRKFARSIATPGRLHATGDK